MTALEAFPRIKRKLLVQFPDGSGHKQTGFTQDLSFTGLFVFADALPRVGTNLTLELHLPSGKAVTLTGNVVRHGRAGGVTGSKALQTGFGFTISGYNEDYTAFMFSVG